MLTGQVKIKIKNKKVLRVWSREEYQADWPGKSLSVYLVALTLLIVKCLKEFDKSFFWQLIAHYTILPNLSDTAYVG